MHAHRFRFSIRQILGWTTITAVLLAGVHWLPSELAEDYPGWPWLGLCNEVALILISAALLKVIGDRSHYDFTLGFVAFVAAQLLFSASFAGFGVGGFLLHTMVPWGYLARVLEDDFLPYFVQIGTVLLWGVIGGTYATWRARRFARHSKNEDCQ